MLRIYDDVLGLLRSYRPFNEQIERHDGDLARQLRRSLTSVPLNVAEGSRSRGKNRNARYQTAAGSMQESVAALQTGEALGYVPELPFELLERSTRVIGVLMKCARST